MNTEHTNQSRAQFEAWASEHCCAAGGISFKRFSDDGADSFYNDPSVETAWQAWQAASQQQAEPVQLKVAANNWPKQCPITRRDFFMEIDGVPTYGGPYDSYTIPEMTGQPDQPWHERELFVRRYDHDFGSWVEDEFIPLRVIHEDVLMELEDAAEAAKAEPAAPAVKESLTAEPQAELATLCASCARANVDCPIYPQQADSCVEHSPATQQQAEPVAWVRFCSDGCYEGPIMNSDSRMDGVRRTSGAWTPLYAAQPPAVAARIRELEAQLNAATTARQEAQQVAQEAIEARNRAGVEIRRPLLKRIAELEAQQAVAPDDVAKDAARYRWMRQDESEFSSMAPAELDAAIDKAIAAAQKGGAA